MLGLFGKPLVSKATQTALFAKKKGHAMNIKLRFMQVLYIWAGDRYLPF